jgi:retron-type reverse transcriptase
LARWAQLHALRWRAGVDGQSIAEFEANLSGTEPVFHADSYGYRPGKSAIDAVRQARQRCWRCDWVLDLDVRAFFDSIDWELLLKAVRQHTDCPWVLLMALTLCR